MPARPIFGWQSSSPMSHSILELADRKTSVMVPPQDFGEGIEDAPAVFLLHVNQVGLGKPSFLNLIGRAVECADFKKGLVPRLA